jgi:hypothetical protein
VISLTRIGGLRLPQFRELLEIGDSGAFTMWRSVSKGADTPSPVGRFGGELGATDQKILGEAAESVRAEASRTWIVTPDSPVDTLTADGVSATLGIFDPGEGVWKDLAALVRPLLHELTAFPVAAVDGGARLEHIGTEALTVDLADLDVQATQWRASESVGRWKAKRKRYGEVVASSGWQFELPIEHRFKLRDGDRVAVEATFAARDNDLLVPVSLRSAPT